MTTDSKFADAAKGALCTFLGTTGSAALSYAAYGLFTPGPFDEWAALGYGAVASLAYGYGCQWDPNAPPSGGSGTDGCTSIVGGAGSLQINDNGKGWADYYFNSAEWTTTRIDSVRVYLSLGGRWISECKTTSSNGLIGYADSTNNTEAEARGIKWRLRPVTGSCGGDTPPVAPVPPHTHTDPGDSCEINVTFQGYLADTDGTAGAVWKLEPKTQQRASGGVIGGCNFSPVVYYQPPGGGGGGGGGPIYLPWDDGGDDSGGEPWWAPAVRGAIGGATQKLLDEIFKQRMPADVYRIVSVCEKDAQGEPISQAREFEIPAQETLTSIVSRLNAIAYIMQGLKDFKQPICDPEPTPPPVGRNISVQFRSTVPSPFGENPLRKVFRYRDPSMKELELHRDHWKNFTWESGPWMVISEGLSWGKPQVWAKSEAEGKRVLQHAAAISGVDLSSSAHRWRVSEVQGYRERPVLTMKVHRDANGQYWVAERTGSEGLPMLEAELPTDPGVGG